jgi:hypothetical protein
LRYRYVMMKSKFLIVGILILLSIPAVAQNDGAVMSYLDPRSIDISAGIGASTIYAVVENTIGHLISGGSGAQMISVSPSYNCMFDYSPKRRASFGIAMAYQQLTYNPADRNGNTASWFIDNASRLNVGVRILEHFSNDPNADLYMGLRFGVSSWSYDETINQAFVSANGPNYSAPTPAGHSAISLGSVQILIGYKLYLSDHIGIHIEAGIGTPYYAEAGLTYRIYTRR